VHCLWSELAVSGYAVVGPEVRLDDIDKQREGSQGYRGADCSACWADAFTVERVAHSNISLDGESEYKQWTEVLRRQEEDRKHLAQSRPLEQRHVPLRLQFKEYLAQTNAHSHATEITQMLQFTELLCLFHTASRDRTRLCCFVRVCGLNWIGDKSRQLSVALSICLRLNSCKLESRQDKLSSHRILRQYKTVLSCQFSSHRQHGQDKTRQFCVVRVGDVKIGIQSTKCQSTHRILHQSSQAEDAFAFRPIFRP